MRFRFPILAPVLMALMLAPTIAGAMRLAFPGNATLAAQKAQPMGSYLLPVGGWHDGKIKTLPVEGRITEQAWMLPQSGLTSLQLLDALKKQLAGDGFKVVYECETQSCGGFDFRYNTDVLPEPAMHVDLGDFRYLAVRREGKEGVPEYASLLISRSGNAGFVQLIQIGPEDAADAAPIALTASTKSPDASAAPAAALAEENDLANCATSLEEKGSFILEDLIFETGSSALSAGKFASLTSLAQYLKIHPDRKVMLVGHTDAKGSLAGNIALSRKRAASVEKRLVADYGVDPRQLTAQGMGYLAPRASNLTDAGRTRNRRVEVILTSTR